MMNIGQMIEILRNETAKASILVATDNEIRILPALKRMRENIAQVAIQPGQSTILFWYVFGKRGRR